MVLNLERFFKQETGGENGGKDHQTGRMDVIEDARHNPVLETEEGTDRQKGIHPGGSFHNKRYGGGFTCIDKPEKFPPNPEDNAQEKKLNDPTNVAGPPDERLVDKLHRKCP